MEAVKTLGVARGVSAFHRVGLFERRGKGYYLSSSLGYYPAAQDPNPLALLLGEIETFRQDVYTRLREGPGIPERIMRARQSLHAAVARLLIRDEFHYSSAEENLRDILNGVSTVEREVSLLKDRAQILDPCPPLSQKWLADEGSSSELRLGRAIGGIAAWGESSESNRPVVQAARSNLLPVQRRGRSWQWDETSRSAVWSQGASLSTNLIRVLRRRLIDAQRGSGDGLPLWSTNGATFSDLLAYWEDRVDEGQLVGSIHGAALLDSGSWDLERIEARQSGQETPDLKTSAVWFCEDEPRITLNLPGWLPSEELRAACELPRVYHLLKLCYLGGHLPPRPTEGGSRQQTGSEPFPPECLDVLSLLESNRLDNAAQVAARKLRAKGYPAILRDADLATLATTLDCQRLASMMLIPVKYPGVLAALAIRPEATTA